MTPILHAAFAGLLVLAAPAWAQAPNQTGARPAPQSQSASPTPPPDANANAPKGPALAEEPHGEGSVYEELDAIKKEAPR